MPLVILISLACIQCFASCTAGREARTELTLAENSHVTDAMLARCETDALRRWRGSIDGKLFAQDRQPTRYWITATLPRKLMVTIPSGTCGMASTRSYGYDLGNGQFLSEGRLTLSGYDPIISKPHVR
jgi:hypothetical protein